MYIDEDTWKSVLVDNWDANGRFWRTAMVLPILMMEYPMVYGPTQMTWDLLKGTCLAETTFNEFPDLQWKKVEPKPERYFTPDNLAVMSTR